MIMSDLVNKYISDRYNRWLDYSSYHCSMAGLPDEAFDVLNEVLCSLLQKDESILLKLLGKKDGSYTELDYFVLRMIKLNATSATSPYRQKYASTPKDCNIDVCMIDVADSEYEEHDYAAEIFEKVSRVRDVVERLNLSDKHKRIFEFRFFLHENFKSWDGPDTISELYKEYNKVLKLVKDAINGSVLI